jgi:hypothetical protein
LLGQLIARKIKCKTEGFKSLLKIFYFLLNLFH